MLLNKPYIFIALLVISAQVSAENLRDPTLPGKSYSAVSAASQNQHQALVLNSIVSSGNTAYAVINNKIVSVGDSIQGVEVVRITPSSVSLSDGRKLALFQAITER
ncbi:MSHA biogenesis protein MshK [Shewanella xiamenensis]|uniref:MSHA biogenesis protein MshK n=1 Tax=Shewanella xiamenensis TaxID=332186 RepID=UPI000C12B58A|nr:MSHA biogenesis protein MshK [Shewanella xiamenensis]MBW0280045.1 MSHA biogenesis protein MshK [Shewanella xiamenensis]MBW0296705.1 MSHA biogenesis protein MshK [Shewanella xiamenensis]MCT8873191.1 MSHA biogenesis protein MshK [Shewanella xiamenensis]MDH1315777.1 MSHA biogenesis protein MshK [Shewanella xiamenensis]PHY62151.1 MSHA biogenesis protein MshK [Shewanella xiamenensis]